MNTEQSVTTKHVSSKSYNMQMQSEKRENIQKAIDNLKSFIQGNIPSQAV